MRIVFFGTPALAIPSLAAAAEGHSVAAVVCQPDRAQGRSKELVPPPTKIWAIGHGMDFTQPTRLNDGKFEAWLKDQAPDACVLCAYGRILKQPLLDVPKHGFINIHPSLLPRHRGPSPIQTAILTGDKVTGVTIMRLTAEVDAGDILLQQTEPILLNDTTATLSEKLGALGGELLRQALALIEQGKAVFTPQDHAHATFTKTFKKEDGRIRWSASATEIHNLVRAAIPWPVAHCYLKGQVCRILETVPIEEFVSTPPGAVVRIENDAIVVASGNGLVAVRTIQIPGKKAMSISEFLRGHVIREGDLFEDLS